MGGRVDELEGSKAKLSARLTEAEETIDSLNQKVASTEKTKHRLEVELEDLQMEYERVHAAAIITEKRGRNFDKVVGEWKAKVDDLSSEVEASQKEARNYNSELFRLKAAWDETVEQLDVVKRENKNLADEIKDLLDQLGDGGRSIHELDKQRRRLEVEESRALLDSAERAKRQLDSELADARNAVNEMGVINSRAMHDKRNVESMIHTLQAEIDDALAQAKNSEEKSKRAMVDAARLADELRSEQDHANAEGRGKRSLDTQLAELEKYG